jgi:hypothetical protein
MLFVVGWFVVVGFCSLFAEMQSQIHRLYLLWGNLIERKSATTCILGDRNCWLVECAWPPAQPGPCVPAPFVVLGRAWCVGVLKTAARRARLFRGTRASLFVPGTTCSYL